MTGGKQTWVRMTWGFDHLRCCVHNSDEKKGSPRAALKAFTQRRRKRAKVKGY